MPHRRSRLGREGHLVFRHREGLSRPLVRQEGEEGSFHIITIKYVYMFFSNEELNVRAARVEQPSGANGDPRGLPRAGCEPSGRRGHRLPDRDGGHQRRPPRRLELLAGRRVGRAGAREDQSAAEEAVRSPARALPVPAVQVRGHGHEAVHVASAAA